MHDLGTPPRGHCRNKEPRMGSSHQRWIAPALAACAAGTAHAAQEPADLASQAVNLRLQVEQAEKANVAVRQELDLARSELNESWVTQQRVAAIGALVQEVLADAEIRSNLSGDGLMMGWSDGFFMASADGSWKLSIGGLLQTRLVANWRGQAPEGEVGDEWVYGFENTRMRFDIAGSAFDRDLQFLVQPGYGRRDPDHLTNDDNFMQYHLWDAWARLRLTNEMALTAGIFKLPFTRESLVSVSRQLAVERTMIDHRMGLGRSQGVMLTFAGRDTRLMAATSNGSPALFHGSVWNLADPTPPLAAMGQDVEYAITLRHEWKLAGDWAQFEQFTSPPGSQRGTLVGVAFHGQHSERTNSIPPPFGLPKGRMWGVTADVSLQLDGASAYLAVLYERQRDFSASTREVQWYGLVAQASTYLTNSTELYARWELGGPDEAVFGGKDVSLVTIGLNRYLDGHDVKFTADVGFSAGKISSTMLQSITGGRLDTHRENQIILRSQLQLVF